MSTKNKWTLKTHYPYLLKWGISYAYLKPGDVVFAFTDGVPEALNTEQEEFGEERLHVLACRFGPLPVDEMVSRVTEEVRQWIGNAPQHDDLTLVVIKTV